MPTYRLICSFSFFLSVMNAEFFLEKKFKIFKKDKKVYSLKLSKFPSNFKIKTPKNRANFQKILLLPLSVILSRQLEKICSL